MNKISAGGVIARAYAFTFGEIGTVIGLVWIPTVLSVVGSFLLQRMMAGQPMPDPAGAPSLEPIFSLLYLVVSLFLTSMIGVALTRQVLGLRKGPAIAHFAVGGEELRVMGGFAMLYLLLFVFTLAAAAAVMLLAGALSVAVPDKAVGQAATAAVVSVGVLVAACALLFVMVRLSFLMIPSAVGEGGFGLTRSWELTKGNFWRIVAVALGTLLPVFIVLATAERFILGPDYFALVGRMLQDLQHIPKYAVQMQAILEQKSPMLLGLALLMAPISNGLFFTPAAFAYQMIAGKTVVASNSVE
jgi:hypothetical protein